MNQKTFWVSLGLFYFMKIHLALGYIIFNSLCTNLASTKTDRHLSVECRKYLLYLGGVRESMLVQTIIKLKRFDISAEPLLWFYVFFIKYSLHENSPETLV